jgi:ATP-dependent Clp protease adaptor protein ClpS
MATITEDKPRTRPQPRRTGVESDPAQNSSPASLLAPRYAVILHNDDVNSMEWVITVLQKVFGYSIEKAVLLMFDAHTTGKSRVWAGPFEIAEHYADLIVSYGPDPRKIEDGAKPLRVTLEPLD